MSYVMLILSFMVVVVGVLICVAFIVLMERSVLGYIQLRKGPNKVGVAGVLQSFSDAVKLFSKEQTIPVNSDMGVYYLAPLFSFSVVLMMWMVMPTESNYLSLELGVVLFFCCSSFSVYGLLASGWASNSNYAMLGAVRGVAQAVSYEVALMLFFLSLVCMVGTLDLSLFMMNQNYLITLVLFGPVFLVWVSLSMAETNRTPFDFAEGESELVSGFNVEYMSGGFALMFLAEYASIIFMSYLMALMFLGGLIGGLMLNLLGIMICFVFIWVRGTLPRLRYDKLMEMAWSSYLPLSLCYFMLMYSIKVGAIT